MPAPEPPLRAGTESDGGDSSVKLTISVANPARIVVVVVLSSARCADLPGLGRGWWRRSEASIGMSGGGSHSFVSQVAVYPVGLPGGAVGEVGLPNFPLL